MVCDLLPWLLLDSGPRRQQGGRSLRANLKSLSQTHLHSAKATLCEGLLVL